MRSPWRHSLCCALAGRVGRALRKLRAALSAAELALPLQRRFLRRGLVAAVCILLLSIAAWFLLYLLFYNVPFYYFNFWRQCFFSLLLATALVLLLLAPMVWLLRRGWDLLRQLGPFTARLSAVRSGGPGRSAGTACGLRSPAGSRRTSMVSIRGCVPPWRSG